MNTTLSTPHGAKFYKEEPDTLPMKNWVTLHYFDVNGDYLDSGICHKNDVRRIVERDGVLPCPLPCQ